MPPHSVQTRHWPAVGHSPVVASLGAAWRSTSQIHRRRPRSASLSPPTAQQVLLVPWSHSVRRGGREANAVQLKNSRNQHSISELCRKNRQFGVASSNASFGKLPGKLTDRRLVSTVLLLSRCSAELTKAFAQ